MSALFLDDIRQPRDVLLYRSPPESELYALGNWQIVRNFQEFTDYIEQSGLPDLISFDHDLGMDEDGGEEPSGYDCAKWLVAYLLANELPTPRIRCHSQNPVGKANILGLFGNYQKHVSAAK